MPACMPMDMPEGDIIPFGVYWPGVGNPCGTFMVGEGPKDCVGPPLEGKPWGGPCGYACGAPGVPGVVPSGGPPNSFLKTGDMGGRGYIPIACGMGMVGGMPGGMPGMAPGVDGGLCMGKPGWEKAVLEYMPDICIR